LEEGAGEALRAAELDPLSLILQWTASALIYYTRQYDRAIAEARKCLEMDASFPHPWWTIALSLAKKHTGETGIEELESAARAAGENQLFLGALGHCYAVAGRRADALRVLERFRELSLERPYGSAYWPAAVCASLGERDEAFRLLEIARKEPSPWMPYVRVAPFFDDLRSDPRFDAFLRRMNFPES